MVSSACSVLLLCTHAPLAPYPRPTPRSPLLARTAAKANVLAFRPGGAGGRRRGWAQICRDSSLQGPPGADSSAQGQDDKKKNEAVAAAAARIASGGGGGRLSDWTTSVLLFGVWAGIMYYVFQLAPNQTPVPD